MKKYFIITSHGWSASNWLAYALNMHPDIICTHSARNILASEKEMNSDNNLKKNLSHLHKGYVLRQNRSLDAGYDEIEQNGQAEFYGSVHVYRMRDLPVLYKKYGSPGRRFQMINLIRHPVSLVWSGYGQFKELFRYDLNELHWTLGKVLNTAREFVFNLSQKYDIYPGDFNNLAFLGAAAILGSLKLDFDAEKNIRELPNLQFHGYTKMEEITRDRDEYTGVLQKLCVNQIEENPNYFDRVFKAGIVNQHKNDPNKHNAKYRYQQFNGWQKEAFNYYMNLFDLYEPYNMVGYDLSFL